VSNSAPDADPPPPPPPIGNFSVISSIVPFISLHPRYTCQRSRWALASITLAFFHSRLPHTVNPKKSQANEIGEILPARQVFLLCSTFVSPFDLVTANLSVASPYALDDEIETIGVLMTSNFFYYHIFKHMHSSLSPPTTLLLFLTEPDP